MQSSSVKTLLDVLARRAAESPQQAAFLFDGESCSYADLWRGVNRFATFLLGQGVAHGERVVVAIPNSADFFFAFYGIQRAGGIAVPIFPGSGAERIAAIAHLCGARLVVSPFASAGMWPTDLGDGGGAGEIQSVTVAHSVDAPVAAEFPEVGENDLSYIQYTSGSTGDPKGVQLSHADLLTNVRQMIAGMEITEREVFVSWLPVYHDMGLVLKTMVPFYLGTRLILLPTSLANLRHWLETIQKHRATFTAAPDFAYRLCLRYVRDPSSYDLSSLRVALNAAEPVRASTITEFEGAFGLENVMCPGYGLAEATVGVSMWKPGTEVRIDERGFVSVGQPFPEIDIKILKEDRLVKAGEAGEILIQSPANTRGYFNNPEASAHLFWNETYLRTGDLGYLDADGNLYIVGRIKNIIIQAGRNVAPREVEEAVEALPYVRLSAAVGIDRGRVEGEQVYVFAEVREDRGSRPTSRDDQVVEIVGQIQERLGFRPGRVLLLKPKTIPLTHNGKKRHAELKQRYLEKTLQAAGRILFPPS